MSTIGHSATIQGGVGSGTPPAGDVDIYLDVGAGNDANTGASWAQAFLTWEKAMAVAQGIIDMSPRPATSKITIYVDNSTAAVLGAADFTIAPNLPDRVRLNVVCPTDRWTALATGTVGAAGITAELGDGLANVVVAGIAVAATDVGRTLRLTRPLGDPNFGEVLCGTILAADTINLTYTISVLHAVVPAFWDADALTIAEVLEPNSVLNGSLVFAPKCGVQSEAGLVFEQNWLFGIRCNNLILHGDQVAAAACDCRTAASPVSDGAMIDMSADGATMRYITATLDGVRLHLSDARARTWGIFGTTAVAGMDLGNACDILTGAGGSDSAFSGYVVDQAIVSAQKTLVCARCRLGFVEVSGGGFIALQYFRVSGTNARSCFYATGNGTKLQYADGYIEEVVLGQPYIALSLDGAMIVAVDNDLEISTNVAANYPQLGWVADSAMIDMKVGVLDTQSAKIQGTMLWAVNEADFKVGNDINMVTARPGVGNATDIVVADGSRMTVDGTILKTVPNTVPGCCLDVDDCSLFVQKSGAFTHGAAPADWTASYGNLGLIHVADDSRAVIGRLTDGGVGAGANIALQVRRKSSLWVGANSALTQAGNGLQVGVVAAPFNGAAVQNDLPADPAGNEELCVVGPTASP